MQLQYITQTTTFSHTQLVDLYLEDKDRWERICSLANAKRACEAFGRFYWYWKDFLSVNGREPFLREVSRHVGGNRKRIKERLKDLKCEVVRWQEENVRRISQAVKTSLLTNGEGVVLLGKNRSLDQFRSQRSTRSINTDDLDLDPKFLNANTPSPPVKKSIHIARLEHTDMEEIDMREDENNVRRKQEEIRRLIKEGFLDGDMGRGGGESSKGVEAEQGGGEAAGKPVVPSERLRRLSERGGKPKLPEFLFRKRGRVDRATKGRPDFWAISDVVSERYADWLGLKGQDGDH